MDQEIAVFAQTTFRNQFKKFGIKTDDRRRHMYLIGKTGMGKSTIQENMIVGDIRAGHGLAVVDPHGDLAEKIIEYIPSNRIQDVVYFNPSDIDYPIAFNVLEQVDPHLRHLVASGLLGVFQKLWADSWGPRLEYILRNTILAILDFPGSTLLGVVRMLSDKSYRKRVVANIKDPVVKAFWEKEFASYADKFASEAVSPIQNKVGQFLSSSLMRNIIGQVRSSFNIREIMDQGKILIMNLSKGRIGEDNSALLGAMMITKIQLAAMSRVDVPEKERKDFYLYIDEFQNFSTDSFANILSEARKYHLNLILAHQYIEQLSEKVKPAVFGNVGTIIAFRVGAADAEELAKEFAPVFTEEDLVNLPKYEMYLKLMIDGVASSPFSAKGLPPLSDEEKTNNVDQVIAYSRKKYASSRAEVEEKILRWHEAQDDIPSTPIRPVAPASPLFAMSPKSLEAKTGVSAINQPTIARQSAEKNIERGKAIPSSSPKLQERLIFQGTNTAVAPIKQAGASQSSAPVFGIRAVKNPSAAKGYHAICSRCGAETTTVFVPDGIRPVFCKDCLSLKRQERKREEDNRRQAKAEELQAFKNIPNPSPSLSLSSLRQARPVDFRGRPEKIVPPIKKNDFQEEGQDMAEDELIDFSRRPE
ncbi:MAG TPA: type IV secretion system DNA-binding domain-containing protein [bacterium]|nr:MAG: AAA-like domain protein [Parcubacteria group bacterium ADurb.Bin115]HNU81324.1 type IV secretion system DNA-binding domain-containing protein [bacterium]HPW05899.1 type IV secretion system DNA-binding domain-containing protein [bacterium]HQB76176.1 type IV secretion system DNA-binding domain-containing protein [bacterium]